MEPELKEIAEKALKFLCVGSQVEGIKFYGTQLLFSESEINHDRINGQIYLNIEGRFSLFHTNEFFLPINLDELPELDWVEGYKLLCELRLKKVIDVKLGENIPHLIIYFETGEILFIDGHHDKFESWQLGVLNNLNNEVWDVIACPGDNIVTWVPKDIL